MVKAVSHDYLQKGFWAHWLRRAIHLSSLIPLWLYYHYGSPVKVVWIVLGLIVILEIIRLLSGITVFGQRAYESNRISAFAWGAIAMGLVLLLAPGKQYAIPIIAAYAISDPLLGELRSNRLPTGWVIAIGLVVIGAIWWLSSMWWGTPRWLVWLMAPVTVAAEWPCFKWIDDNALIQLVPLLIILLIHN